MSTAVALPGVASPAVGFDQPFAMLHACHERVGRSLALFERLVRHVREHGHDAASRSAARDVLRYFDLAAPHHHQDEERHVLPRLRACDDAGMCALAQTLVDEHRRMEALWAELREPLQVWAGADEAEAEVRPVSTVFPLPAVLAEFLALQTAHLAREEAQVYPLVAGALDDTTLAAMGEEMSARRRA